MLDFRLFAVKSMKFSLTRFQKSNILKENLRNFHQMAQFGSRTVALASRSHFQIFYSDIIERES